MPHTAAIENTGQRVSPRMLLLLIYKRTFIPLSHSQCDAMSGSTHDKHRDITFPTTINLIVPDKPYKIRKYTGEDLVVCGISVNIFRKGNSMMWSLNISNCFEIKGLTYGWFVLISHVIYLNCTEIIHTLHCGSVKLHFIFILSSFLSVKYFW